jgi:hypothetical protein
MPKTSFSRTLKELYARQFTGNTGKKKPGLQAAAFSLFMWQG